MSNLVASGCATIIGGGWTAVTCNAMLIRAGECTRGIYQANLVNGREALSGSTLRGEAKRWSVWYARSASALLARMQAAAIPVTVETVSRRRILVIG
jgi:hypothetical protein